MTTWNIIRQGQTIATVEADTKREATIAAQREFGHGAWVMQK